MLSDIFVDFEIEEDCNATAPPPTIKYDAQIHNVGWFLTSNDKEAIALQAAYYYNLKQFSPALDAFKQLLECENHNRVHAVGIYDSILRCALKVPSIPLETTLKYLHEYHSLATSYGDQMQYWSLAKDVLANINEPWAIEEYLQVVSLLCATVDLPEHWLSFGDNFNIKRGPNYRLGYLTRSCMLLERHMTTVQGFVRKGIQTKLSNERSRLTELGETQDRIDDARRTMTVDLLSIDDRVEIGVDRSPAHLCKSKIGVYKTPEQIPFIVSDFKIRYKFMFVAM